MYISETAYFSNPVLKFMSEGGSMKCCFEYCVYQKDNACTLDTTGMEINGLGMYEQCEMVSLDEEFLATAKRRRLDEITQRLVGEDED